MARPAVARGIRPEATNYNCSLFFNGVDNFALNTTIPDIRNGGAIEILFYMPEVTTQQGLVSATYDADNRFGISVQVGVLRAGYYNGSSYIARASGNILPNTWYRAVASFTSPLSNTMSLYINKVLQVGTSQPALDTQAGVRFGRTSVYGKSYIQTVRVWNTSLTVAEITSLYNGSIPSLANLKNQYLLQEGAGSIAYDTSGNSNNATFNNAQRYVNFVPSKSRKLLNSSLVNNSNFNFSPPLIAATTTSARWIDGTAAGSTTNDIYKWGTYFEYGGSAQFDTSNTYLGNPSMKLATTANPGSSNTRIDVNTNAASNGGSFPSAQQLLITIPNPNTPYTLSFAMKTDTISSNNSRGARAVITSFSNTLAASTSELLTTYINGTTDWTIYTGTFTTTDARNFIKLQLEIRGETGTAWFADVKLIPYIPPVRQLVNRNLVYNGNFKYYPPTFVAATTTKTRWIDGTAAGSTTNSNYRWSNRDGSGTNSARFDTTTYYNGLASLKVSTLATSSWIECANYNSTGVGTPTQADCRSYLIPVLPSTTYTYSYYMKTNYVSGDSINGATVAFSQVPGDGASIIITNTGGYIKTTTDWTQYTGQITTDTTARYMIIDSRVYGHTGTGTLIMDAWFDDIVLRPTTPATRTLVS